MLALAISASESLGISLIPCPPTQGGGNSMFEACVLQLGSELRAEERDQNYWRDRVANFVQSSCEAYSRYYRKKMGRAGTKQEQWKNDWDYLRKSGNYNCWAGDLLLPGLAACMKRNVLVFNTYSEATEIYTVHLAETLGGKAARAYLCPLILCYDGSQYEGLEPSSEEDIIKCDGLTRGFCPEILSYTGIDSTVSSGHNLGQPKLVRDETRHPGTLNICFVNAAVQLLSVSGIAKFLITELPDFLSNAGPGDYSVSRALASLYSGQGSGEQSAAILRR